MKSIHNVTCKNVTDEEFDTGEHSPDPSYRCEIEYYDSGKKKTETRLMSEVQFRTYQYDSVARMYVDDDGKEVTELDFASSNKRDIVYYSSAGEDGKIYKIPDPDEDIPR